MLSNDHVPLTCPAILEALCRRYLSLSHECGSLPESKRQVTKNVEKLYRIVSIAHLNNLRPSSSLIPSTVKTFDCGTSSCRSISSRFRDVKSREPRRLNGRWRARLVLPSKSSGLSAPSTIKSQLPALSLLRAFFTSSSTSSLPSLIPSISSNGLYRSIDMTIGKATDCPIPCPLCFQAKKKAPLPSAQVCRVDLQLTV
ncbi:hypothetical protein VTN31DRAFT_446 [Thermomyces dupontii]|uniref:uncharacterized protein n=1 Tax=Talaromyces thermophilus TaxID=28565 RepID=UPI003742471B